MDINSTYFWLCSLFLGQANAFILSDAMNHDFATPTDKQLHCWHIIEA